MKRNCKGVDTAVVNAWIGDTVIHSTEDHIHGIEVVRNAYGVVCSAILNLYDDTALRIESLVYAGAKQVRFQYGWTDHLSPIYRGDITKHQSKFGGNSGATLRIEISASEIVESTNPKKSKAYRNMPLSSIVADVAKAEGWEVVYITNCDQVPDPDKVDDHKPFYRENETGMQFIRKLLPYANKTGRGSVVARWGWDPETNKIRFLFKSIDERVSSDEVYIVGGSDERVISWDPVINTAVTNLMGSSSVKTETFDRMSNDFFTQKSEISGDGTSAFQITRVYPRSSGSDGEVNRVVSSIWKKAQAEFSKATLVIVGSPDWNPTDHIDVAAYTKYGVLHHSSGIYTIEKGVDLVNQAGFITTLELTKIPSSKEMSVSNPMTTPVTNAGAEKSVDGVSVPKGATVNPGTTGVSMTQGRAIDYGPTFPVAKPKNGDIVYATTKIGDTTQTKRGIYLDPVYVMVDDEFGQRVVPAKTFLSGAVVEYRRKI